MCIIIKRYKDQKCIKIRVINIFSIFLSSKRVKPLSKFEQKNKKLESSYIYTKLSY